MRFGNALLKEELNQPMADAMKAIKDKISADPKLPKYIDEYNPNMTPYAYVLSKGKKYSLHCHIKWSEVSKKAAERVKFLGDQDDMEESVADKIVETIQVSIIGADYSEYSPKVKRNGVVIEVILTVPTEAPAPVSQATEEPLTPPQEQ